MNIPVNIFPRRLFLLNKSRRYSLNPGKTLLLDDKNKHFRDSFITFEPVSHSYQVKGIPIRSSVTQIIHRYFETFDKEAVVQEMMKKEDWPRPEYTHADGTPFTAEEILNKWDKIGEEGRLLGTSMHESIEKSMNGLPVDSSSPEFKQFLEFKKDYIDGKIIPYRTEWKIYAENVGIAGSVDFIGQNIQLDENNKPSFVLMDWKRTKKAPSFHHLQQKFNETKFMRKAKPPIAHLVDSDEMKYSLQLNFYKYILTNYYDLQIDRMIIAAFHPLLPNYLSFEVPDMQNEIHEILCDCITRKVSPSKRPSDQ